jgi:sarcosine oxidase subunit beta
VSGGTDAPDVVVVGGGIVGLATAWTLARRGATVVVLERRGIGSGQSGVQPGGVRQQWGTAIACRLARESVAFWEGVDRRLESAVPLAFSPCGYLFLAHAATTLERLGANVALQNRLRIPSRLVSATEAAELVPDLQVAGIVGAAWCPEDGYVDRPQSALEAFARDLDVRIAGVTELRRDGSAWLVATKTGSLRATAVVVAAGIESVGLLAPLGVALPIEPEERHLFLSSPISERLLEPLVVSAERGFAAKQLADGRVLASDLAAEGDADTGAPRWRARVRDVIRDLLPSLEYADLAILVSGTYDVTPDRQPILGEVPGSHGLFVAAGFSGHGFMIAPAVSRILADAIEGRRDDALDVLDAGRFAEGRLVPEPQVI